MSEALAELDAVDAVGMHRAAAEGDPEAKAFFASLFPDGGECLLCGQHAEPGLPVALVGSPDDASKAFATTYCQDCWELPALERARREMKMMRLIWPHGRWKLSSDRNSRGRRVGSRR